MSTSIQITDDGDETIIVSIEEDEIGRFDHDEFGWAGMEKVINLVEEIAETFDIFVHNTQDIV